MRVRVLNKFRIGCDPEFGLQRNDGLIEMDIQRLVAWSRAPRAVGQDCGCLVELRPTPSYSAWVLCKRLKRLILSPKLCNEKALSYKFRAGAYARGRYKDDDPGYLDDEPITFGGHIHFDADQTPSWRHCDESYAEQVPVVKALHGLTSTLERLDILPASESKQRREDGEYGCPYDIRTSSRTFEFREMCSWLFSPQAALTALTLAKLVALHPNTALDAFERPASYNDTCNFVARFSSADDDARMLAEVVLSKGHTALEARPWENFLPKWRDWQVEMSPRPRKNRLIVVRSEIGKPAA